MKTDYSQYNDQILSAGALTKNSRILSASIISSIINEDTWLNKADVSSVVSGDLVVENHNFKILSGNYV